MTKRERTRGGRYQMKREDTLVKTIEKKYGVDLNVRSDAQLHTVLRKHGAASLSQLLKKLHGQEA